MLDSIVKNYVTNAIATKIGEKLGLPAEISKSLAAKAVPLLLGAMAGNAAKDEKQATGLFEAITKDHDGSIFDNLDGFLGNTKTAKGDKILGHILGNKEAAVETALAVDNGIDKTQAAEFMQNLAPLVMGALGKEQSEKGLDIGSLAKMFATEKQETDKQKAKNPLLAMLDQEGNGVADDLLKMGMGFLKNRS